MVDYDVEFSNGFVRLTNGCSLKALYTLEELGLPRGASRDDVLRRAVEAYGNTLSTTVYGAIVPSSLLGV